MSKLSKRFLNISESKTVALTTLLHALQSEGRDVVALGAGEPDFETPENIREAGVQAIRKGFTRYTSVDGIPELKEAILFSLKEQNGVDYKPSEIIITCGAKHAVYQGILALCDEEDEVLLPVPYWVSYPEQVKLAGASIKYLRTTQENQFKITAAQLYESISSKTKLLILNNPSNPSGAVYTHDELSLLAKVVHDTKIYILSDEVYDKLIYDGRTFTSLLQFPFLRDQLLLVNGFSKSFAMTGWRIGFIAGDQEIIAAIKKYQGHSTTHATSISQYASVAALTGSKDFQKEWLAEFEKRRQYVYHRLQGIPKISSMLPQGAFYFFPRVSEYYGAKFDGKAISNSSDLCEYLLKNHNVAIVPGYAFGMDDHVRLSFAASMENLEKALNRIEQGFLQLL